MTYDLHSGFVDAASEFNTQCAVTSQHRLMCVGV